LCAFYGELFSALNLVVVFLGFDPEDGSGGSSEKSFNFYWTVWRYFPEDGTV
jgi:hypothetical protein